MTRLSRNWKARIERNIKNYMPVGINPIMEMVVSVYSIFFFKRYLLNDLIKLTKLSETEGSIFFVQKIFIKRPFVKLAKLLKGTEGH